VQAPTQVQQATMATPLPHQATASLLLHQDIVFLYRLVPGYVAPSYGIHCARVSGCATDICTTLYRH
jgi:DNA mismatch repair ATPase MutS